MVLNAVSWNKLKLIDVVDFLDEKRVPLKESERLTKKGIYPYYGASGIIDYVDDYIFDGEFILLGEDGANIITRSTRLAFLAKGKIWVNNHAHVMTTKDGFNNYFICEYLESLDYTKYNTGTAQPKLNKEVCKNILINIPPLREQEKIAEILLTWDLAINKQQQLIEKKKEFKKGLMQRLLTGEVRFKSEIGEEYPDWKLVELGDYLIKHNEKSEYNGQYPVLTSSRKGIFLQSEYYSGNDVASDDTTGYNVVPRGYFTYRHMSDDLIFKFNINDIVDKGIVSTLYPVFTVKDMDPYFLRTKLNEGNEFKRFALSQKQGGSRTYMYFSKLEKLKVNIPSLEEQKKISEVLKTADKEIELLEKELEALKLQKKGLMQRLLTGEVRVNVE